MDINQMNMGMDNMNMSLNNMNMNMGMNNLNHTTVQKLGNLLKKLNSYVAQINKVIYEMNKVMDQMNYGITDFSNNYMTKMNSLIQRFQEMNLFDSLNMNQYLNRNSGSNSGNKIDFKMNIRFEETSGITINIACDSNTTISQVLKQYLNKREINQSYRDIMFLYGLQILNENDQTTIKEKFGLKNYVIIKVNIIY